MNRHQLARMIDHTLLKPEATLDQVEQLCNEAAEYHFASVCVNPIFVPFAVATLAGSDVAVCTVAGFPLGATSTASKVCDSVLALSQGAMEIDMVMAVGLLKAGKPGRVRGDISAVASVCHAHDAVLKVIIETALLTDADYVKTSTGFAKGGATVEDVALMRKTVGPEMGVKAAGGIHTYEEALAMIEAGATRIGASRGIAIVEGAPV